MNKSAIIFDLDMTLINTSRLEKLRNQQKWNEIRDHLSQAEAFPAQPIYPHQLPRLLKEQGHPVAILTSYPRGYAQDLINKFGIAYDAVIAYDDTAEHKPHPAPILYALRRLGCSPEQAFHVGDQITDMQASFQAGVRTIGAGWGISSSSMSAIAAYAPDLLLYQTDLLLWLENFGKYGYFLESEFIVGNNFIPHLGSVLGWKENSGSVAALGRYFKDEDARHENSILSRKITELKYNPASPDEFANAVAAYVMYFCERQGLPISAITSVPPKPGQTNRFDPSFEILKKYFGKTKNVTTAGLVTVKTVEGYKRKGRDERKAALAGAFMTDQKWEGNVVLVDDIYTTGSTSAECASLLKKNGAKNVITLIFGRTQFDEFFEKEEKICPVCGRRMTKMPRKYDGKLFWSCTGIPKYCSHTEEA